MSGLAILLGTGLAIFVLAVIVRTYWGLTRPPRKTYAWAVSKGKAGDPAELDSAREFAAWSFVSRGVELPVWEITGDMATDPGAPTLIITHGWGDSRLGSLVRVPAAVKIARRVIVWDLPGHGEASGVSRLGGTEDADLLELLARLKEGDGESRETDIGPVVLYGVSMGAGICLSVAARHPELGIAAVIAEAPYRFAPTPPRNLLRVMRMPYRWNLPPVMWVIGLLSGVGAFWNGHGGFDRKGLARGLACPLLVIHGDADELCPLEDGRAICNAAADSQMAVIDGAGHNNLWTDEGMAAACERAMVGFVERVCGVEVAVEAD